jgi:hypothetical protein
VLIKAHGFFGVSAKSEIGLNLWHRLSPLCYFDANRIKL